MNALVWLLLAALGALAGAEVIGWCVPAQHFLIRRAAATLRPEYRGRYVEEWTAELDELPDAPLTRFVFAASLLIRRRRLASEYGARETLVSTTARRLWRHPLTQHWWSWRWMLLWQLACLASIMSMIAFEIELFGNQRPPLLLVVVWVVIFSPSFVSWQPSRPSYEPRHRARRVA